MRPSERKIFYLAIYLIPQKDKKLEQYVTDTLPENSVIKPYNSSNRHYAQRYVYRHTQPQGYSVNQSKSLHCLPKCPFIWEAHGLGYFTDDAQRAAVLTVK